jgi:hypothetical protein
MVQYWDTKEVALSVEAAINWVTKLKYNVVIANHSDGNFRYLQWIRITTAAINFKLIKFYETWQENPVANKSIWYLIH